MNKFKFNRYNDGVAHIYREKEKLTTDFTVKKNVNVLDDMDFIVKLAYEESTKREQDLEFANQQGFSLTAKIRTRYVKGVDNKCKAVIDGILYDISYIDFNKTEMWLYLEGVKKIDT